MKVSAWKLTQSRQGGGETPTVELIKETELEVNINLDQEFQEDEEMQPEHSGNIEFLPSESSSEDTNLISNQTQQSGDIEIIQENSQQLKMMKTYQDTEKQEPSSLRYVAEVTSQT